MAYVPNATNAAEPLASESVESAALEFRTLKASITARVDSLTATVGANKSLSDAADGALDVRLDTVETQLLSIATGTDSTALAAALGSTAPGLGAALIGVADAGGLLSAGSAEAALQELAARKAAGWVSVDEPQFAGSIQAALNASLRVYIPAGTYTPSVPLTATAHHQIMGAGFNATFINPSHTGFALVIPAPVADVKASLLLDQFTVTAKNGIQVGGTRTSHPTDGAIIGGMVRVCVVGSYSNLSGDAAYDTAQVRDAASTLVSSASGTLTTGAVRKTFDDVESYGVGLRLCKCIDTRIEAPQFYGNGVSVALLGCDLIKWSGGRSHEVGLFMYSERVGTWGSQAELRGVDLLHNRRAGGILLNGTKFDRVTEGYYECYSNSALFAMAEQTEGALFDDNRIDDPYYGGAAGTTPIALFVSPRWGNKLRATRFQKFSAFSVAVPAVRVTGSFSSIDTNHPEAVAIEPSSAYAPIRFKDMQPGCRYGNINPQLYTPANVPLPIGGSGMTPLAVADGVKNVFYNAAGLTLTARFDIPQLRIAYTLSVNCKVTSGTTLFASVEHHRFDGSLIATPFSGTFGGFVTTAYQVATQALALSQEPADGDYLLVVWTASAARVAAIEVR